MNKRETIRALKRVRKLIDKPEKWTKQRLARNRNGSAVPPKAGAAVCFCIAGAFQRELCERPEKDHQIIDDAREVFRETVKSRGFYAVVLFNDYPYTTHADVMDVFNETIERLEQ